MIKPNFFLIGASKAGTTSIAQALGEHPQVFITNPKEPDFFNQFDSAETIDQGILSDYLKLYTSVKDELVIGEASVSSLHSTMAAKHIYNFNPDAKILILLRNPLQRIYSLYEMYIRQGLNQSFEFAIKTDPWLVRQCCYHDAVKRYFNLFPAKQVYWIDFEYLKRDWNSTLTSIHNFLDIEAINREKPIVRNTGGVPKGRILNFLTNRAIINFAKGIIPNNIHNMIDKKVKSIAFKKLETSDTDISFLRTQFIEDLTKLDKLLDSDFAQKWLNPT